MQVDLDDVLFQLLNTLCGRETTLRIAYPEADEDNCDRREKLRQIAAEVIISLGHRCKPLPILAIPVAGSGT
jgi:hypothetical protein